MITFLSGGTGTPKLLRGMQKVMDRHEIAVIVNTAEDIWISGNHISPDVDTVMYLFAGILNTDTWWGVRNDTFITHDETTRLGIDEFIAVGDRDRAVHIARAEMLRGGMRLTNVTKVLCERFGVRETVLPMADTEVTTQVETDLGLIHFQEYLDPGPGQDRDPESSAEFQRAPGGNAGSARSDRGERCDRDRSLQPDNKYFADPRLRRDQGGDQGQVRGRGQPVHRKRPCQRSCRRSHGGGRVRAERDRDIQLLWRSDRMYSSRTPGTRWK